MEVFNQLPSNSKLAYSEGDDICPLNSHLLSGSDDTSPKLAKGLTDTDVVDERIEPGSLMNVTNASCCEKVSLMQHSSKYWQSTESDSSYFHPETDITSYSLTNGTGTSAMIDQIHQRYEDLDKGCKDHEQRLRAAKAMTL